MHDVLGGVPTSDAQWSTFELKNNWYLFIACASIVCLNKYRQLNLNIVCKRLELIMMRLGQHLYCFMIYRRAGKIGVLCFLCVCWWVGYNFLQESLLKSWMDCWVSNTIIGNRLELYLCEGQGIFFANKKLNAMVLGGNEMIVFAVLVKDSSVVWEEVGLQDT